MSTACMSIRSSISRRICSVHGSAPKIPTCSDDAAGSRPCRTNSSMTASMYDGVSMMISGRKSVISWTWRGVIPPDTGIAVAPSFSMP